MGEHATTDTVVDLTTNGDSTGELLTSHTDLFGESNTNVVGTNQGECIRIEVGVSRECRWVNFLEGGSITVEGLLRRRPFGTRDHRGHRRLPGSPREHAARPRRGRDRVHFVFRILLGRVRPTGGPRGCPRLRR
jgi:hypothetical protein